MTNLDLNILVIGPSGAGKSYIVEKLEKSHPFIYDADKIPNLASWHDSNGEPAYFPENASAQWLKNHEFLWNRKILEQFIRKNGPLVIFGLSENCFDMADLFDKIFYLDIEPEELKKRLQKKDRLNPFGSKAEQLETAVDYMESIRDKAKKLGVKFLDAHKTPEQVIRQIF